jgi:hypothetical protein
MRPHRALALLLMATLLTALSPWSQGEGCRLCGKLGRCCCTRPMARRAAAPHCKAMGTACSMDRSGERPAALRAPRTLPERTGAFATLAPAGAPEPAGLVTAAGVHPPSPFFASPPTPPPRDLRSV